jgi:hypothetical protein
MAAQAAEAKIMEAFFLTEKKRSIRTRIFR